jgi:hypothetical protein
MCSKFRGDVLRRTAPALRGGQDCLRVRRGALQQVLHRREVVERVLVGLVALGPAPAGASATTVCARPRAASPSERKPPSELPTMCAV